MFSRFLEPCLDSASHSGCPDGIIAAIFAMQKANTTVGDMVMRTGASSVHGRGHHGRIRPDAWSKRARKRRLRRIELEGLESRTLLATIPAAAATGNPVGLTSFTD